MGGHDLDTTLCASYFIVKSLTAWTRRDLFYPYVQVCGVWAARGRIGFSFLLFFVVQSSVSHITRIQTRDDVGPEGKSLGVAVPCRLVPNSN